MREGPAGTLAWLREAEIRPRKAWGQNFLINARVAERMADRWDLGAGDGVLEIGAGAGSLTLPLLLRGAAVLAVERDPRLCDLLRKRAEHERVASRLCILGADILDIDPRRAIEDFRGELNGAGLGQPDRWVLVGNLPYRFTAPILEWTVRFRECFSWVAFMVQEEVGNRLLAAPGRKEYGSLTVWIRLSFGISRQMRVGPGNFWPIPKVDSVVVRLDPHVGAPVEIPSVEIFEQVLRAAFGQRRKMIAGALAGGLRLARSDIEAALAAAGVDARCRAEQCDLGQFAAISRALAETLRGSEPDLRGGEE